MAYSVTQILAQALKLRILKKTVDYPSINKDGYYTVFDSAHIPATHYDLPASLKLMGKKESVVRELAIMLRELLPDFNAQLKLAFEKGDTQEIQLVAHKLHGGICYVVTPRLKYLINCLETACKQHTEEIALIKPYIGSSIDALHDILTKTFK